MNVVLIVVIALMILQGVDYYASRRKCDASNEP